MALYLQTFWLLLIVFAVTEGKYGGNYKMRVVRFESCKGPKRINCTDLTISTTQVVMINYDIVVKQNVDLTYGRVSALSLEGKELFNFRMKKPCDHFFVKANLETFFNVTDDCVLLKNHYVFSLNVEEVALKFYKDNIFFGDLVYKSVFTGKNCNAICTIIHIKTSPK